MKKEKIQSHIENLTKTNRALLKRAILLITFSIVGFTFHFKLMENDRQRIELENSRLSIEQYKPPIVDLNPKEVWLILEPNLFKTDLGYLFDSVPKNDYRLAYHQILDTLLVDYSLHQKNIELTFEIFTDTQWNYQDSSETLRHQKYHALVDTIINSFEFGDINQNKSRIPLNNQTRKALQLSKVQMNQSHYYNDTAEVSLAFIDSTTKALNEQIDKKHQEKKSVTEITIFGLSVDLQLWGMFASIVFTVIFLNFCRLLVFRDRLWKRLQKSGVKVKDIGPEYFIMYTPNFSGEKHKIPTKESIVFSLFLVLIVSTINILDTRPITNSEYSDSNLISWINLLCFALVIFEIVLIIMRQNLLRIKDILKSFLPPHYWKNKTRPQLKDLTNIFAVILLYLLGTAILLWSAFSDMQNNPLVEEHLIRNLLLFILLFTLSLVVLPLGLYLQKHSENIWFKSMTFSGAIVLFFWLVYFFLFQFPWYFHSLFLLSIAFFAWGAMITAFILYLAYKWNRSN